MRIGLLQPRGELVEPRHCAWYASGAHEAVACARGVGRYVAEPHIVLHLLTRTLTRLAKAATAGGLEPQDVALLQHEVHHLGGQRLAHAVARQVERAERGRLTAR